MSRKFGLLLGTALAVSMGVAAVDVQAKTGDAGAAGAANNGKSHAHHGRGNQAGNKDKSKHKGADRVAVEGAQDTGAAEAAADRRDRMSALEHQIAAQQKAQ